MKIKNFIKGLSVRPILNTTKGKSVSNWVVNAGMFGGRVFSNKAGNIGGYKGKNNVMEDRNSMMKIIGSDIIRNKKEGRGMNTGYVGYFNNYVRLASIHDILNMKKDKGLGGLVNVFRSSVLEKLMGGKVYRMLVSLKYVVDGKVMGCSPMKSIMVTRSISSKLVLERIEVELRRFENEYNLDDYSGDCFVG